MAHALCAGGDGNISEEEQGGLAAATACIYTRSGGCCSALEEVRVTLKGCNDEDDAFPREGHQKSLIFFFLFFESNQDSMRILISITGSIRELLA